MMIWWLLFPVVMFESAWHRPCLVFAQERDDHECNSYGVCLPGAEDVAVSPRTVTASNTCGDPPGRYCQKGPPSSCFVCNSSSNTNGHPVDFMIDRDRGRRYGTSNLTSWWQSQTWWEWLDIHKEDPLVVNITLSFNKTYVITGDIRINFRSPKPLKMVIEKSADFGNTWIPLQYFADKCSSRFNMRSSALNCSTDTVLCTERYSDPKPGPVYFSFLNCYTKENFWEKEIQNLINATDLRLRLEYPGTDGLETIKTEERLNRYFYAISDIQVFGRCQCNGHARNCEFPTKILNGKSVYVNEPKCMCEHHTTGVDCEKCEPLYNNKTWMPATSTTQANPCESEYYCYYFYNYECGMPSSKILR